MKNDFTAIFPTVSNPPTFGTIFSLFLKIDLYDKIYVIIQDKELVMTPQQIKNMLEVVLCKFTPKFVIIIDKTDFKHTTTIPDTIPPFDDIITTDADVYANLISKGYLNTKLIESPMGWDESFHRIAFERSLVYTKIRNTISAQPFFIKKKKKRKKR